MKKKTMKPILKKGKKTLDSLTKKVKEINKLKDKVERIKTLREIKESETNAMEERLNQTKPLDALKERKSELQRQNEEDQAIIQDENASPDYKDDAQERVAERNEEIARLETQIAEMKGGDHSWKG